MHPGIWAYPRHVGPLPRDDAILRRVVGDHRYLAEPHAAVMSIEPVQLVALVGQAAPAKSTLRPLVARLLDPAEGRVLLDDHDVRD